MYPTPLTSGWNQSQRSRERKSSRQPRKDMFRFGIIFINKNHAKAPKKPKTCLGGRRWKKRMSWRFLMQKTKRFLILNWRTFLMTWFLLNHYRLRRLSLRAKRGSGSTSATPQSLASIDILQYWTWVLLTELWELHALTETSQLTSLALGCWDKGTSGLKGNRICNFHFQIKWLRCSTCFHFRLLYSPLLPLNFV